MNTKITFKQFLESHPDFNGDIFHDEYDDVFPSIVDLNISDLTEEGLKKFQSVLDAEVVFVRDTDVCLSGVKPSALNLFASALCGMVSQQTYDKWFAYNHKEQQ